MSFPAPPELDELQQMPRPDDAARLIMQRWLHVVWSAVVGATLVLVLAYLFFDFLRATQRVPVWVMITTGVAGLLCSVRIAWGRMLAFFGLKHLVAYPPVWIAGIVGASLLFGVVAASDDVRSVVPLLREDARMLFLVSLSPLMLVLLALLAAEVAASRAGRGTSSAAAKPERDAGKIPETLRTSFERICAWASSDEAVMTTTDDVFEHRLIARRIASRLRMAPMPAQAIVGRLGAGKTTLRHLVNAELHANGSDVVLVPIELWPFETPRAAVEGVIRALIKAVAAEVPVLALRGVPELYAEAMSAAGGVWGILASVHGRPANPLEALRSIDDIGTAIDRRYVVWVEDLERFARGGAIGDTAEETLEESERLNPIRALLLGLERLKSVSVITATTTLHSRFDIDKIARYVEEIPPLHEGHTSEVLKTFRDGCLSMFSVRDPADPVVRRELDGFGQIALEEQARRILGSRIVSLASAVVRFCSTPRTLKTSLRLTLDTWQRFPGELDFDDVLVMSVLRSARPDVFAAIAAHVATLRRTGDSIRSELLAKEQEQAWQEWQEAVKSLRLDNAERAALDVIVQFVFKEFSAVAKPQGLRHDTHTNYWQRFLSVPEIPVALRDQTALGVIAKADDGELLAWLEDPQRHRIIESFGHHIETEHLLRLLELLARRRAPESMDSWPESDNNYPPGLIPLWRLWNRRSERDGFDIDLALKHIQRAYDLSIATNLAFVAQVEHFYVTPSEKVTNILEERGDRRRNEQAREYLRSLLVETFRGKPSALADALRGSAPWILRWLLWGIDRVRAGDLPMPPFSRWNELADTVLDAARAHPDVMLHPVAGLVTEEIAPERPWQPAHGCRFKPELAEGLFGSVGRVLQVFAAVPPGPWSESLAVKAVLVAGADGREAAPVSA